MTRASRPAVPNVERRAVRDGSMTTIAPLPAELLDTTGQDHLVAAWNALRNARQVPFEQQAARAWTDRFSAIMNEAISHLIRHARAYGVPAATRSGFDHTCVGPSAVHRDIPEHDRLIEADGDPRTS